MEAHQPPPLTQEEIELLLGFEELIRQRQQIYQERYRAALDKLLNGAPVEKGRHCAELGQTTDGRSCLVIDGLPRIEFLSDLA